MASACDAGRMLRKVLHALDAPCTPWMHVCTCHLPQFLQQWGTLETFLCHGFEGRWWDLKVEIKHSTHRQWKGAKFGFETVIQCSIATWVLMKLKVRLVGRSFHAAYPCHDTCRGTLSDAPPPPLRVMVARPAQATQVTQEPNPLLHGPLHGVPCHAPPPPPCHGGTRDIGDTREVHKHNKAQAHLHKAQNEFMQIATR